LRAKALRGFGGDLGAAAGAFQVGDCGHKFMIFEGFHFPEFPDAQRQTRPRVRLSFKENRIKLIDLTNFGQEIRV
jgi:hypothetical protein